MLSTRFICCLSFLVGHLSFVALGQAADATAVGRNEVDESECHVVVGADSSAVELFDVQALLGLNKANYDDIPNESRLEPKEWGEATVE